MNENILARLSNFYVSLCNDDWEHTYGFSINNIDNPGWEFKADLRDTYLEDVPFDITLAQRKDELDWYRCEVKGQVFDACCGPKNLEEVITIFLNWAEEVWSKKTKPSPNHYGE